jgi:branched-chain amino acid transport system permease protein
MGVLSLSHAAFYGVGAYAAALVAIHFGVSLFWGMLIAGLCAAVASLPISAASARLRDDQLALATFAFQVVVVGIMHNWTSLTNGPMGIRDIPRPSFTGIPVRSSMEFLILGLLLAGLAILLIRRIACSPFGRLLWAIREDEIFAASLGRNTLRCKLTVFGTSAMLAGLAGALYASYVTYIDPSSFGVTESILCISMIAIGGPGSCWGAVLGASTLVVLPEALCFLGLPTGAAANLRQIIYGTLLVVMMIARPQGFLGRYAFGR